jgi:hypothetical protein
MLGVGRTEAQVFSASGDLTQVLAQFRAAVGDPANTTAGEQAAGRRQVNWDVSPEVLRDTFPGPSTGSSQGQVYRTNGTGFRT